MNIVLDTDFTRLWMGRSVFAEVRAIEGELYRDKEGRRTLQFTRSGKSYFLKHHRGVGWLEIIKNLLQGRWPVLGAEKEYAAIRCLQRAGIDTLSVAAFGVRGWNPATQESFLITHDLVKTQSLEDVTDRWRKTAPSIKLKRVLLERVAQITRDMHAAGLNHRDYYLCHLLVPQDIEARVAADQAFPCHVIDLHRAQVRSHVPMRWQIKDLGALYFSAFGIGLTQRDCYRFLRTYRQLPLRQILRDEAAFWQAVRERACAIHVRDCGTAAPDVFARPL